jgi:hypothetical protein
MSHVLVKCILALMLVNARRVAGRSIYEGFLTYHSDNDEKVVGEFHVETDDCTVNYGILVADKSFIGIASVRFEVVSHTTLNRTVYLFDATDVGILTSYCKSFQLQDVELAVFDAGPVKMTVVIQKISGAVLTLTGILESTDPNK